MRAVFDFDSRSRARRELSPHDPFLQYMSAARCKQEVYVDSGDAAVPPLRRCKLAVMCAMLHVEDEPYARCIGGGGSRMLEETQSY